MIEEVVLPHGAHVGVDALALITAKLLQREALPLGRRLHHLQQHFMLAEKNECASGSVSRCAVKQVEEGGREEA